MQGRANANWAGILPHPILPVNDDFKGPYAYLAIVYKNRP